MFQYSDIDFIYLDKTKELDNDLSIYCGIWQDFVNNLIGIGCDYWACFYNDLFNNSFQIDKKRLEVRVNIPEEIRKSGASKIGKWLVKNEKLV